MSIFPQFEQDLYRAAERVLTEGAPRPADVARRTAHAPRTPTDAPPTPTEAPPTPIGVPPTPRRRGRGAPRWLRSGTRAAGAWLPVGVATLIAIAIAVVAVGTLRHSGHEHQTAAPRPAHRTGASSVARERTRLVSSLAVLRAPQDPAQVDRPLVREYLHSPMGGWIPPAARRAVTRRTAGAPRILAFLGYPRPDIALLRTLSLPQIHAHVLLTPASYRPLRRSRTRAEGISLLLSIPSPGTPSNDGTSTSPISVSSFLAHGLMLFVGEPHGNSGPGALLVPDGVARVALGPARPKLSQTPDHVPPAALAAAIAGATATVPTATVHDNLAAFTLPVITIHSPRSYSFEPAISVSAPITWYAADGSVIRHTTTTISVFVKIDGGRQLPKPPFCRHLPRPARLPAACRR